MTRAHAGPERDLHLEAEEIIADLRAAVESGEQPWFDALLEAVRRWPLASERVGDRDFQYLVAGEAFDWLLLAERLSAEIAAFVPEDELDALLFEETLPGEHTEEEFGELLGAKYKPHLNFVYGVRVEAALQMAVAEEIGKEHRSTLIWERSGRADDEAFGRIYGRTRQELFEEFAAASGISDGEWLSLGELSAWRYWLFQYRVKYTDPAKVASDTRKGLAMLQRLEAIARRRTEAAGIIEE
jgi:hypothetical protein